jgi:hypothetical protein
VADQTPLVTRVDIEQLGVADDLVQARGALQGADLLEHALIVARPCMPCTTSCSLRFDRRFICTAAFTMANSSGAATIVKPISISPLNDLGRGNRMPAF